MLVSAECRDGISKWKRSPPSLHSSSSSSVYLKFEFDLRNISWNADIEKKKKKLHPAAAPEEPCGIWPPPSGGKSALSNTNMAKSPRHSRGNATTPTFPRPGFPNIPAVTCGPLPGAGLGPRGARGWDHGACEIENNKSPQWKCFCWTIGTNRRASSERTPPRRSQPRTKRPSRSPAGVLGPALPTLQNSYLTAERTALLQSLSLPFLRSETQGGKGCACIFVESILF